jgi:hypothetical protein
MRVSGNSVVSSKVHYGNRTQDAEAPFGQYFRSSTHEFATRSAAITKLILKVDTLKLQGATTQQCRR